MGVMPPSTLSAVGGVLRARSTEFRDEVHRRFYLEVLEARQVFPIAMRDTHVELAPALAWVFENTPVDGAVPDDVLDRLRRLGLDHRRHGFPAEVYPVFLTALRAGLAAVTDEPVKKGELEGREVATAWRVLARVCSAMGEAAREADLAGEIPATAAEVVTVERRSRRISVIRLESGLPVPYRAGQHMPVSASYLPGTWRLLSPALPSDEHGQIEFHVSIRDTGSASQLLATPRPGDYWTLGAPRGELRLQGARGVVMIAHATGLAPLRSILFELLRMENPPQVHLFLGAEYPGELYDLSTLWQLSKALSWLTVIPVVEHATDAWWVRSTVPEESLRWRGNGIRVAEEVGDVVLGDGPWPHYEVLVAGDGPRVRRTVDTLLAGGVPGGSIRTEEWEPARNWRERE